MYVYLCVSRSVNKQLSRALSHKLKHTHLTRWKAQQEFDEEKQRLKAVCQPRNPATARRGEEALHFFPCTSPPPLQEEDDPAGRVLGIADDLPATVVATKETGDGILYVAVPA
jgi:hypothetical protein